MNTSVMIPGRMHLDTATVGNQTLVVELAVPSQFSPATHRLRTADSTPVTVSRCALPGLLRLPVILTTMLAFVLTVFAASPEAKQERKTIIVLGDSLAAGA